MAKLRFKLGVWNKGLSINGRDAGTGFLCVEEDNTVAVKNLFKTTFLFELGDVKTARREGKDLRVETTSGDIFELRAKPQDLDDLARMIKSKCSPKAA